MDSTADLNFNDYEGGKVVGIHATSSCGDGLKNKSAKEIVIPEFYLGKKVVEVGENSFRGTDIESIFVSRYVKSIMSGAFYGCTSLKYITFDANSELEFLGNNIIYFAKIESINLPSSLKNSNAGNAVFYHTSTFICGSYFGSNDLSSKNVFSASTLSSSFVVHAMPNYAYEIGSYTPIKDGQRCPEKTFQIQLKKSRNIFTCRCAKCSNLFRLIAASIFLIAS